MHNALNFMRAARTKRPREQHLKINTKLVDDTIEVLAKSTQSEQSVKNMTMQLADRDDTIQRLNERNKALEDRIRLLEIK